MHKYCLTLTHTAYSDRFLRKWCIDVPESGQTFNYDDLYYDGITVTGWALPKSDFSFSLVILCGNQITKLGLNEERPDVISRVLGEKPHNHRLLKCGFTQQVCFSHSEFSLGVVVDGKFISLLEGKIESEFNVLEGEEGWLFLDNDTNRSVEQFRGKLKLSRQEKKAWEDYFKKLCTINEVQKNTAFLIAPSKEEVASNIYPYKKTRSTPAQKVKELAPDNINIVYPVEALKSSVKRTYRIGDTHWSHNGAKQATVLVAESLGFNPNVINTLFDSDIYADKMLSGDLASKLYPKRFHTESVLTSFNYREHVYFDNKLTNFGRIKVIYNNEAYDDSVLLLFGSSSAYSMFNYLSRIFRTIVFCHTAGNIDPEFTKAISPKYLIGQTNGRFVIKAPGTNESVFERVKQKLTNALLDSNQPYIYRKKKIALTKDKNFIRIMKFLNRRTNEIIQKKGNKL